MLLIIMNNEYLIKKIRVVNTIRIMSNFFTFSKFVSTLNTMSAPVKLPKFKFND